jgi:FKBP-type peptidyl-prolyl cis-trans isomerase SlyD
VETITKNSYVVFNYTLTDDQGRVLSSSEPHGPLDYIHGTGTLIPGLERTPREQFGFEGNIEVGMQFQADTPSGAINLTVTNVTDKEVTVDANHPFSGINLNFKVSIVECRPATKEELEGLSNHACNDTNCGGCGGGHGHSGGHGGCGC